MSSTMQEILSCGPNGYVRKLCIEVTPESKIARISETLCIGCGICAKKCPFEALTIINLPSNLEKETTHRYSANSFKLHRLPIPRPGEVLGLVGTNGIGKSTALKILAGKQKPNLGRFNNPPDWQEILLHFRGSELQNYFTKILEDDLKAIIKPQYVDQIPKAVKGSVQSILDRKNEMDNQEHICRQLDLLTVLDRNVDELSGGELQRFACAVVCIQRADIYMFDEPSSYLDVKQRLKCALTIRSLLGDDRDTSLVFKVAETADKEEEVRKMRKYKYPKMEKQLKEFHLGIDAGEFTDSEIIVMLGENADVYLIDEPSAYLDSEQRLVAAKVIKRFILHAKKTGFVVEHDFIMATYLADRVVVFEGEPSVKTLANRLSVRDILPVILSSVVFLEPVRSFLQHFLLNNTFTACLNPGQRKEYIMGLAMDPNIANKI
ncbi:ATP-binding cassette sub-family E member 1 [Stylophora pistillata]|uniref:ATP-binding cassette sub-family E member 1 n=1 Tax=Stylophora pistillata TaxID=50429 RepID=A0A2B4RPE0_STYPI|nr:ATP-binding cassette sub-family E member 1 [Stylophora pistillata]